MKILYIIDWAGISGGAEVLVMNTITSLPGEKHLAYYWKQKEFDISKYPAIKFWDIGIEPSWRAMWKASRRVKNIIKSNKIDIVYSHLYWSNSTARLATPTDVKLFTCIQNIESRSSLRNKFARLLERVIYRKSETTFCCSDAVNRDYLSIVPYANTVTLYNCINDVFFNEIKKDDDPDKKGIFRLISVGYIKPQKNYDYLLQVFSLLKQRGIENIELDVFGGGPYLEQYRQLSSSLNVKINFKGENFSIEKIIRNYDGFILASLYEGFGIATVEAMASKIPLFLSDIPVNREITGGNAVFFDLRQPMDAVKNIEKFLQGAIDFNEMISRSYIRAMEMSKKEIYLHKLIQYFNQ